MSQLDSIVGEILSIKGAIGAAIGDTASGMALAAGGTADFDIALAATGGAGLMRDQLASMGELQIDDTIEDLLVTLGSQYHLVNALTAPGAEGLFIYVVLDRKQANLSIARHKLRQIAASITM